MRTAICDRCGHEVERSEGFGTLELWPQPGDDRRVARRDLCMDCWRTLAAIVDDSPAQCGIKGLAVGLGDHAVALAPRCELPAGHKDEEHRDGDVTWRTERM